MHIVTHPAVRPAVESARRPQVVVDAAAFAEAERHYARAVELWKANDAAAAQQAQREGTAAWVRAYGYSGEARR